MLKIQDSVRQILLGDEEALSAVSRSFMNLSGYAAEIRGEVERQTKKEVKVPSIVVALSRIQKEIKETHPLLVDVVINSINTKSPVAELVYDKSETLIKKVASLAGSVRATADDFLNITISTNEIGILCSDRILEGVRLHFKEKPKAEIRNLAVISLAIDPDQWYPTPNVTYSLIRRIAQKKIVIAESLSTYGEIIFVFNHEDLSQMVSLFSARD